MTHTVANDATDVFNTLAPNNSSAFAEEIAYKHYAIQARACVLSCERDQVFMLKNVAGPDYILRFINPAEDCQVVNFQTEAMLHLALVNPDIPVPRIIKSIDDKTQVLVPMKDGRVSLIQVTSFIGGIPLANINTLLPEPRRKMTASLARHLAQLDLALKSFNHRVAKHELPWDLKHATNLREMLVDIDDREERQLASQGLDAFERFALPMFPRLRSQVIHNDLNFSNVMVDDTDHCHITGIIDFGDMVHGPLINELGVAASYHLDDSDDPLAAAAQFIAAYHQELPLEPIEFDILYDLIVARLVMIIAITHSRAKKYPDNRHYILRNNQAAKQRLKKLSKIGREQGQAYFQHACAAPTHHLTAY